MLGRTAGTEDWLLDDSVYVSNVNMVKFRKGNLWYSYLRLAQ